MKKIIYNQEMLERACNDLFRLLSEKGQISLEYGEVYKDRSKAQCGFFFGALVDSVIAFFAEQGMKYAVDEVKNNFYNAVSYLDDEFKKKVRRFNGEEYEVPKHISDMTREEMSKFIDRCIYLIDNAKPFHGMKLAPDIRNTWIRHITHDDLRNINVRDLPYDDKEYIGWLHKQACLVCGCHNGIEAHHLRIDGVAGVSKKPPVWMCVPLCSDCHRQYHLKGHEWFLERVKWLTKWVSIKEFAILQYVRWKNHI